MSVPEIAYTALGVMDALVALSLLVRAASGRPLPNASDEQRSRPGYRAEVAFGGVATLGLSLGFFGMGWTLWWLLWTGVLVGALGLIAAWLIRRRPAPRP